MDTAYPCKPTCFFSVHILIGLSMNQIPIPEILKSKLCMKCWMITRLEQFPVTDLYLISFIVC